MTTGRNDPCPCGSGRKYKQCCLAKQQARPAAPADAGVGVALAWLQQRFRRQVAKEVEDGFFAGFDPQLVAQALGALGKAHIEQVNAMIADYVLSEAIFERDDSEGRGIDWVLGHGPHLADAQRDYLEKLADAPLRLYEVVASRPEEGVELRDAIDESRILPFVSEPVASVRLAAGDTIGARVLRWPDRAELGGVLYPIDRFTADDVMERVRRAMSGEFAEQEPPDGDDATPPMDPEFAAILEAEFSREDTAEEEAEDAAVAAELEDEAVAASIREAWLLNLILPQMRKE